MRREFPELDGLLARSVEPSTAECPDELEWIHLALGMGDGTRESRLLEHAAQCSSCAVLLRRAVESAEDPDERLLPVAQQKPETPTLSNASSNRSSWMWPGPSRSRIVGVMAAAAAIVILIASWLALRPSFAQQKEQIAKSYQSGRPLPFRVSGVPWGPLAQDRGRASSRVIPLPSGTSPEERFWAARACLWEGDYDAALSSQNAVRTLAGDSAELLNDIAITIAARGDRDQAIRLLEQANDRYPRNATILFNLATLLIQTGRTSQAEPLLAALASLESDENWRREASRLLR